MTNQALRPVKAFRNVFSFAFVAHLADLITSHYRNPHLADEGNPLFGLLVGYGLDEWVALVLVKLVIVSVLAAGYWWYLCVRRRYLPDERVHSVRSLIWNGMWDRRPYPRELWRRVFNLRKFEFGFVVAMAIALPASAVAALFASVDNLMAATTHPLPYLSFVVFVPLATVGMFVWWALAYRQYYLSTLQDSAGTPGE